MSKVRATFEGIEPQRTKTVGVKKADLAKYARVVKALETQTGFSLDPLRTFPRWMLRIFFIQKHGYRKIFKRTKATPIAMSRFGQDALAAVLDTEAEEREELIAYFDKFEED